MPGALDSCINNIYEDGNIPASAGIPPVRVLLRGALDVEIVEEAAASASQDWEAGGVERAAMVPVVFINSSGTARQAYVDGVMVNL